jgi:hypothetical protein
MLENRIFRHGLCYLYVLALQQNKLSLLMAETKNLPMSHDHLRAQYLYIYNLYI